MTRANCRVGFSPPAYTLAFVGNVGGLVGIRLAQPSIENGLKQTV